MKGIWSLKEGRFWKQALIWSAAGLMALGSIPLSDGAADPDPCEQEAARAYWEALKVCQLAEPDNPRLRCYDAAKAVYIQTLHACHAAKAGESN